MKTTAQPAQVTVVPRIALFIGEPQVQQELETILRDSYSSLLVVTEREKLLEFDFPFVVIVDAITDVSKFLELRPPDGTQVLVILNTRDTEAVAAAFEAGAEDYIPYPFEADSVVSRVDRHLEDFR